LKALILKEWTFVMGVKKPFIVIVKNRWMKLLSKHKKPKQETEDWKPS
jgi:hypothetical protein